MTDGFRNENLETEKVESETNNESRRKKEYKFLVYCQILLLVIFYFLQKMLFSF